MNGGIYYKVRGSGCVVSEETLLTDRCLGGLILLPYYWLLLSKRIRHHHEKDALDWLFPDRDHFPEVILGRSLSARRCVYKPYSTHLEIKPSKNGA